MGLARLESRQNAARVIRAQRQNLEMRDAETGWCYQNGGQPLFGYAPLRRPAGRNRKGAVAYKQLWVLDESEVAGKERWEWAREMLDRRLAGASYDALAKWLMAEGVPPVRGIYWPRSTVCYLLRRPALLRYAGRALWNVHDNHGKLKPEADWVIIEHGQPAIINDTKLDALLALGQRQRHEYQQPTTPKSYPSPYQGRFFCGRCGSRMSLWRNRGRTYYICSSRKYSPAPCGPGKLLRREEVERGVTRWIAERLDYPEGIKSEAKRCDQQLKNLAVTAARELAHLTKRQSELEVEIASWMTSTNPTSPLWPEVEKRLLALRREANSLEDASNALKDDPRSAIQTIRNAYLHALETFESALEGDAVAMVAVGQAWVSRLEWDPVTEEVRLTLCRTPPGAPQLLVAPRAYVQTGCITRPYAELVA
jgi:hypothetical protein